MAKEEERSERHSEQRENENEQDRVDGETADQLLELAKHGDPEAQFLVGHMFRDGRGVHCDYGEWVIWWRRAAERGHVGAQRELGNVYHVGNGVPIDPKEAMHWYKLAAEQGDVLSLETLAVLHEDFVAIDREALFELFRRKSAPPTHLKYELAHYHMEALADLYDGWALDPRFTPERSARLLGLAEGMRALADLVGPDWDPPEPNKLSIIGAIAREIVEKIDDENPEKKA